MEQHAPCASPRGSCRRGSVLRPSCAGTGFSYGSGMDHDEAGVAVDMYDFLQQFMQAHPKYSKLDFYAVGESYARIRALRSGFARTLNRGRFCLLACLLACPDTTPLAVQVCG